MPEKKAHEVLAKHDIKVDDVRNGHVSLHHLRNVVRGENLSFEVFQALVRLRR